VENMAAGRTRETALKQMQQCSSGSGMRLKHQPPIELASISLGESRKMSTAGNSVDIGFLRLVLASLILGTLLCGGVCVKLVKAGDRAQEIEVAARS
jgi:hypothetical protein